LNLVPETLYVDDALLVINKPAGLLSIPDGYDSSIPFLRGVLEPEFGKLWVVHRLDKDTSGVVVLARTAESHRDLNTQFEKHTVEKVYRALIEGDPDWKEHTVSAPLRANVGRRKRTTVDYQRGKMAATRFKVLARMSGISLLEVYPHTGRTHQIRAHLYHLGFSILSDPLYGSSEQTSIITRLALHAKSLAIHHPTTAEPITFDAAYPEDFGAALTALQSF